VIGESRGIGDAENARHENAGLEKNGKGKV